ncbi:MAG: protein kinase [Kiritimatiellae bacterium]|nr:protein kinase [Kiritimatiellia bacterium]
MLDVSGVPPFAVMTCPGCQTPQKVPAKLDHFLLSDVLGRGGMATVYRAFDSTLGRYVAIKIMRRSLGEDPQFVDNFLREARAAAQLNHRNIVQIYSVGRVKDQPFIVMELLDGGRLDEMIEKQSPLDEGRVMKTALEVAEGLGAGVEAGIVHGDVKPANILFDKTGVAKVTDFGLAKFQAKTGSSGSSSGPKGEVWGTPFYIAPEKVRGYKEDQRSDIYSLGATLYHALAGKPPFDAPTAQEVVKARLENPPPDLSQERSDLSPDTLKVIARMLEPDPFRRYPNYRSLTSDLKEMDVVKREFSSTSRLKTSRLGASRKSTTSRVSTSRLGTVSANGSAAHKESEAAPSGRSSRRIVIVVVALLAAAGVGAGIWLKSKNRVPEPPPPEPIAIPQDPGEAPEPEPVRTESFDSAPLWGFTRLETQVGVLTAQEGHAAIHQPHHRSPPQSLRILGGGERFVELALPKPAQEGARLSFHAERWTVYTPFRFRVDADAGSGYREIVNGDGTLQVGGFKVEVIAKLPEGTQRVRLLAETPPNSGVLIDDMILTPPKPAEAASDESALPIQPFDSTQTAAFIEGALAYLDGRADPAVQHWVTLANSLPDQHVGRMWCLLFTGLPMWEQGNATALQKRLDPLALKDFAVPAGNPPHPGTMPQALARAMLGRPYAAPPGVWPDWFAALAQFVQGGALLQQDRIMDGIKNLDGYLGRSDAEPAWVYAFQPLALRWKDEAIKWKEWRDKDGGYLKRVEADGGQAVVDELKQWAEDPRSGILRAVYVQRLGRAQEAFKAKQAVQDKQRDEQAELTKAGERLDDLRRLASDLNFAELGSQVSAAAEEFKTPAGKSAWQSKRRVVDIFTRLPGLMDSYARKAPFDGRGVRIPGFVVGAQTEGYMLRPPSGGAPRRIPWGQLAPEQFVALASYYVKGAPILESERGGYYLALAWYSTDKPRIQVKNIVNAALESDPSLRDLAAEVLPGSVLP